MSVTPEPIAIVGLACRLPGASDPQAFWELLVAGQSAVKPAPKGRFGSELQPVGGFLESIDTFDAAFFGITDQEADAMDPQQRLLLELSWQLFEDAGVIPSALAGQPVGVYLGFSHVDYFHSQLRGSDQVDMYTITGTAASVAANRLSYFYDLRGPSLITDTACSSSLTAVHLACESLRRGECQQAIAGGVSLMISPLIQQGFLETMAVSERGYCSAFGEDADGMVRGEGAGLVLLKPLTQAIADGDRIYALIRGSAIGQDGLTNGLSAPSPAGQRAVLTQAYQQAGVRAAEIAFIEAHGTGTPLGDPIEARALGAVLETAKRKSPCRLGSVKSNLGHLEPAAGIAGLIKATLALYHRYLPATLHAETPHPGIPFDKLGLALQQQGEALRADEKLAGVSAFGFGGTNVHVVLEHWSDPQAGPQVHQPEQAFETSDVQLIPLSARSPQALLRQRQRLAAWLARPELSEFTHKQLTQLGSHLALRREALPVRQAFAAHDSESLRYSLLSAPAVETELKAGKTRPRLAFVFSGMGSQEVGMGRQLLGLQPFYKKLTELDPLFSQQFKQSVFSLLEQEQGDPAIVQALLFALQLALFAQWQAWGIQPDVVLGSSMGEIGAAVAAGILDQATGFDLLIKRIELIKTRIGTGRLAVVGLPAAVLEQQLDSEPVWVAADNGPELCVVAGESAALDKLMADWQEQGLFVRPVRGATAPSHTPMMAPLGASLMMALTGLKPQAAKTPFWSTVEAQELKGPELGADYWWQNLRRPVKLYPTLQTLTQSHPDWVILELSPHPVLMGGLTGEFKDSAGQLRNLSVLGSLRREDRDSSGILQSLAELWRLGFDLAWQDFYRLSRPFSLPAYAFEPEIHWLKPSQLSKSLSASLSASSAAPAYSARPLPSQDAVQAKSLSSLDRETLLSLDSQAQQQTLALQLQQIVANALRLKPAELPLEQPLKNLGIGSLVGMELYQRLKKELGVALALSDVLKGPSLNQLSALILTALSPQTKPESSLQRPAQPPLSFTQQRFWFYTQLAPESLAYHIPGVISIKGQLDAERLKQALAELISRHEILRTIYPLDQHGQPWQHILAVDNPKAQLQFRQKWGLATESELVKLATEPFQLEQLPPFRVVLLSDPQGHQHQLLIDLHHLVADGYSFKLMFHELSQLYQGQRLETAVAQYADFALWQREQATSGSFKADLDYWLQELKGAPALLPLMTDYPRATEAASAGRRLRFELSAALISRLEAQARELGVSLYVLLLGAYVVLLGRLSKSEDLVIGTPVLGRPEQRWSEGLGPYLNMLPLRAQPQAHQSSRDFLLTLQSTVLAGFDHQDLPFEQLVEALQPERELSWHPVYQHVFALHAPLEAENLGDLAVELVDLDLGVSRFELALTLHPEADVYSGSIEYRSDLFDPETIQGLISGYLCLLEQWQDQLSQDLQALSLNQQALTPRLIGPKPEWPNWTLLERLQSFSESQQPALVDQAGSLTYAELLESSKRVAFWLQSQNLQRPAIVLPRSRDQVIAWLGTLLAGGCYVPLDPDQPPARLERLIKLAECDAVITGADISAELATQLQINAPGLKILTDCQSLPAAGLFTPTEAEVSYLIFTSGSSGEPKGVRVGPDSLLNLIIWHLQRYDLHPADRVALIANPAFDAAGWELWPALAAGASVYPATAETVRDPDLLKQWLADQAISVSFVPTPLLERLQGAWPSNQLRALLTGGDRLIQAPLELPCTLHNHYGPTENTVVTTVYAVRPGEMHPPIGEPLPGVELYLLDSQGRMMPSGLAAELWIGGAGLALDYAGRPDLTAEAFVETSVGRLYRSGDRVRVLANQQLVFLGRQDGQLKVRGIRVESAEIEAQLRQTLQVSEALVLLEQGQLLAWVAPQPVAEPTTWRSMLADILPAAFIPSQIIALAALPLNSRGKLDRQALLNSFCNTAEPIPLQTQGLNHSLKASEMALAQIWHELLPDAHVDPEADFFALGGHSLLALDLRAKVRERLGLELPLNELFRQRSLSRLANWLEHHAQAAPWPVLQPQPEQLHQAFALTDVQQAYWIGRQAGMELGEVSAHAYVEFDWPGLEPERLRSALQRLVQHHPMLRAIIDQDGRQRVLDVESELPALPLPLEDLRQLTAEQAQASLLARRERLSHEVRPADHWPLFGIEISRMPDFDRLHLSFDALMADASSILLLGKQLEALYLNPDAELETLEISFRDIVEYELALKEGPRYARDKAYWLARVADFPAAPALPTYTLPAGPARFERRSGSVAAADWQVLKARAAALGVTPSVVLMTAFAQVLSRWQENTPLSLNLTTFSRLPIHPQINQVIGDFTRLTLLAYQPDQNFSAACQALQTRLLDDLEHSLFSGLELMRELRAARGPAAAQMPVVFTSMLGAPDQALPLEALGAKPGYTRTQTPQVWLDHQVMERNQALYYDWDFPTGLFPEGLIEALLQAYQDLLKQLISQSDWSTASGFSAAAAPVLEAEPAGFRPDLLHAGLVKQAYLTPDAPAVISGSQSLSFGQWLAQSSRLAEQIGPLAADTPVAIWLEPGLEQAIAVLAVLLAGGAYLPLNPDWPAARIRALLQRTKPACVLSTSARHLQLQELTEQPIRLIQLEPAVLPEPAQIQVLLERIKPHDLAYIIFTSGTTGEPKGVMLEHAAAWNTVLDINQRLAISSQDRILGLSDLNFDLSVYDLFGPAACGAALVYPEPTLNRDPAHWHQLCAEHQVTLWNSVPALMNMLTTWAAGQSQPELPQLKQVMLSGDWIPLELPTAIRQQLNPHARLISLGGATEAAIWSIAYEINELLPDWSSIPYGYALRNQAVRVLDAALQPCPVWAPGEIYISGIGLARGYFKDLEQTQSRFIEHQGQRLYRTGDRGRLRADGSIEFLGRSDQQVKVQGYRIELAEIEGALSQHPDITQVVVLAPHPGQNRMQRYLAACVQTQHHNLSSDSLQTWLKDRLPSYMVPHRWLLMNQLPLTATGKVDRQALIQALETDFDAARISPFSRHSEASRDYSAAEPWLSELTLMMQTELGLKQLGPEQDLMALGVNSIDLVRLGNALTSRYGQTPGMGELFSLRSPLALARWYAKKPALAAAPMSIKQTNVNSQTLPVSAQAEISLALSGETVYTDWLSTRAFLAQSVDLQQLARLFESLSAAGDKRLYGSAGGVYPISVYLQLRDQACEGLDAGVYRYVADQHRLQLVSPADRWSPEFHLPPSREMATQSRFSLYFVADLALMATKYGPDARDYCLLEAGAMAQLLRQQADVAGLGLCAVGQVDTQSLAKLLDLHSNQQILHTLIGGLPALDKPSDAVQISISETLDAESEWEEWLI